MKNCKGHNCQAFEGEHSPECIAEHECSYTGVEPIEVVTYAANRLGISTEELIRATADQPVGA